MNPHSDFLTKLRTEIQSAKGYRHDFIMRKFAFGTGLLGLGSFSILTIGDTSIDLSLLLYLVPLVAIAFDLYIITEDYKIKRAGAYLRKKKCGSTCEEKGWEDYANEHPNRLSTIAFAVVTILYLLGAAAILYQTEPNTILFVFWIQIVLLIETVLAIGAFMLRGIFNKDEEESKIIQKTRLE